MADVKNIIKSKLEEASKASEQVINSARDQVATATNYVVDQSRQAAGAVAANVSNAGSYLEQQAENATDSMSGGLKSVARTIRQNAPQDSPLAETASGVAQTFSNAAGYLDRQGFEGVAKDLTAVIKNNPIPALMISIGLGYLLARATQSRD